MKTRHGIVLLWALITLAVTTTILGTIGSYYTASMRTGQSYLEKNKEYYAFLNAAERFGKDLNDLLTETNTPKGNTVAVALEGSGKMIALDTFVEKLRNLVDRPVTDANGEYQVRFATDDLDSLKAKLTSQGTTQLKLQATVYKKGAGGAFVEKVASFEDVLTITLTNNSGGRTNHPIFDYVYFANNRGHLESPYSAKIIANGDVGANDQLTINGAIVNGNVWAHGASDDDNSAVVLQNSPHIWPYALYHQKIANEYREKVGDAGTTEQFYMPVRPTNPIYHGNEAIPWEGGYEPPGAVSEYGTISVNGTVTLTDYPRNNEEPSEPTDLTGATDPGPKPTAQAMPDYSSNDYYTRTGIFSYTFDYAAYGEALQTWYENYGDASWSAPPDYSDQSKYWKKSRGKWSFQESTYKKAVDKWKKGKDTSGTVKQEVLDAWTTQYNNYQSDQKKTTDYQTAWNNWYNAKLAWETAQQTWKNNFVSEDGILLQKTTQHPTLDPEHPDDLTKMTWSYIVSTSTNVVDMPTLSNDDEYRQYCQEYTFTNVVTVGEGNVTSNRQVGGSLVCANRYKSTTGSFKNITYSFSFNDAVEYEYAYKKGRRTIYSEGHVFTTNYNTSASTTKTRTLAYVNVTGGYNAEIYPFAERKNNQLDNSAEDPFYAASTDASANDAARLKLAERGCVILIGTANFPITIAGPVYFDRDVVIRGFVSGHGTIYSGRNIHIIGDLTYRNPPSWPHTTEEMNAITPQTVRQSNADKDLLMLAARGNIIVGNYADDEWWSACEEHMAITDNSDNTVCTDYQDDDIGYSSFIHDYTALEGDALDGNALVTLRYSDTAYKTGYYDNGDGDTYIMGLFRIYACNLNYYHKHVYVTNKNRHFYECILGSDVIQGLMQTDNANGSSDSWNWSSFSILKWLFGNYDYDAVADDNHTSSSLDLSQASNAVKEDTNAGDITQIDAILFANHGIFGRVGGTTSKKFRLHGAMICRDEGLLPSFAYGDDFKDEDAARAWLNWDMRIKSGSAEAVSGTGAPSSMSSTTVQTLSIIETGWRETL